MGKLNKTYLAILIALALLCRAIDNFAAVKINGIVRSTFAIGVNEAVVVSDNKNTSQPRKRLLLSATGCVLQENTANSFYVSASGSYKLVGYDGFGGMLISDFSITLKPAPAPFVAGFAAYCAGSADSFAVSAPNTVSNVQWFVDNVPAGSGNVNWLKTTGAINYTGYNQGNFYTSQSVTKSCSAKQSIVDIDITDLLNDYKDCTVYDLQGRKISPTEFTNGIFLLFNARGLMKFVRVKKV